MKHGGHLSIGSQLTTDQHVEITIADDGCGITEEDKKMIFSPFFTRKSSGTGLGLSISKNIIEDHKGSSFTFTSEEGKGTTFKIRMPVYRIIDDIKGKERR